MRTQDTSSQGPGGRERWSCEYVNRAGGLSSGYQTVPTINVCSEHCAVSFIACHLIIRLNVFTYFGKCPGQNKTLLLASPSSQAPTASQLNVSPNICGAQDNSTKEDTPTLSKYLEAINQVNEP